MTLKLISAAEMSFKVIRYDISSPVWHLWNLLPRKI